MGAMMKSIKEAGLKAGFSKEVISALLGNIKVESNFELKAENMNYSSVARLRAVFPSYFKAMPDAKAKLYVNSPKLLGDLVYAKMAGYSYRGRGFIQLTGIDNYTKFGKLIGKDLVKQPDLLLELDVAVAAAVAYVKEVAIKKYPNLNENRNASEVADIVSKSIQGFAKNYTKGFLLEHLVAKRKECLAFYAKYDTI